MGIKHLTTITKVLKGSEVPLTKIDISVSYYIETGCTLNQKALIESLTHLISENKVKTVEMRIHNKNQTGYKWVI